MVENRFKEIVFFNCRPWSLQELITASAICFEFWTYNHGQKSLDTFASLGRFPIHTGPTPPITPQTVLHACIQIFFFRVSTLYRVRGRRTARTFWKVCTVLRGNREMEEKYEYCSTVPRTSVQDCRLVTMSRKSDHVTPLLFQLHWLPVDQRIEFKVLLFTYKVMQGLAPQYLSDLLEPYSPLRSLRSASKLLLNWPSFNLRTYGYKSFSVCAPRLWNSLLFCIKSSSSVDIFMKRLKTFCTIFN